MVRTQIQITEEQARYLKEMARSEHVSIAEVIRQTIDALIKSTIAANKEERRDRALAAAGRYRSDTTDASERHDDYLAEAYRS